MQRGPEARRGGGLTRFRYLAGTADSKVSQHQAQKRWKGTAINVYIPDSANGSWAAVEKSACPPRRWTKVGVATTVLVPVKYHAGSSPPGEAKPARIPGRRV